MSPEPCVQTRGLTFAYPTGATLFNDLSVSARAGEVLVVTGRSGAGKSTLLYCLIGVLHAEGEVRLMGRALPAAQSGRAAMRRELCGFVFQRGELLPELTVVENVALPLRLAGRPARQARDVAMSALERFGLEGCAQRTPDEISGGQAQRASVARALVLNPPIVIADEPTASLDAASRDDVIAALRAAAAAGAAVVCASHDPALVGVADARLDLTGEPSAALLSA